MEKKIFYSGTVYTMKSDKDVYDGIIINGNKIEKLIKSSENIEEYNGYEKINLCGNVVLPGFIDSHVHLTQTGLNTIGVRLSDVKDSSEMLSSIERNSLMVIEKNLVFGTGYDETMMVDQKLPTLDELDKTLPEKYLWLSRVDSHSCLVNTKFLKHLNISKDIAGVDVDSAGSPTGVLRAQANSYARKMALDMISDETRKLGISNAINKAVKKGVTTIHALEGGPLFSDKDFHFISKYKEEAVVNIEPHFQVMDIEAAKEHNLNRLGGCIILDGSFGSRTAALNAPYSDDPTTRGSLYVDTNELEEFVMKATRNNVQVAFHALGERAIGQIIGAYKKANEKYPNKDLRHRIEHFELPTIEHIKLASEMGIIISVQPAFDYHWGGPKSMYFDRLGQERALMTNPFNTILKHGCVLIGGSDSDVTEINPIVGIHGAVNHSNEKERISVFDAVKMFTSSSAYALRKENELGTLESRKQADFVVLDKDIFQIDSTKIDEINVIETFGNGKMVFSKNN